MTFHDAEQYLLSFSNMPRKEYMRSPRSCKTYLARTQAFLDILGNPEKKVPHYIHITGTSGKGSTTAMLFEILRAAGHKVGKTTSPHPSCITQRWQVGAQNMTKKEFIDIVEEIQPHIDTFLRTTSYEMLSFFELTTAIALLYFAKKRVSWAVLEVGCGGAFDATNVIPHKDVAIVTNIGYDHTHILGTTKSEIAKRKSGIIKPGSRVYTMERHAAVRRIIEQAARRTKTTCTYVPPAHTILERNVFETTFCIESEEYTLPVPGDHQLHNATLARQVAIDLGIAPKHIARGLGNTRPPLAMEVVAQNPMIILDGAHNPAKIRTTVASIESLQQEKQTPLHLIISFSGKKNIHQFARQLAKLKPTTIACTRNTGNAFRKVADPRAIAAAMKRVCPQANIGIYANPTDALAWSKKQAKKRDIILATGSIYMTGELRGQIL